MNDVKTNPESESEDTIEIDIFRILKGFFKFWWLILLLAVVGASIAFYKSYIQYTPMFKTSATFTVHTENHIISSESGSSAYSFYYDSGTADQLASVFPYIVSNEILQKRVCEELDVPYMPASVSVYCVKGTNMITLSSVGRDPQQSYDVLESVINNYSYVADHIIGRTRLVMISNPEIPQSPYNSLSWRKSVFKGALAGAVIGIAWTVLYGILRRTVCKKEDVRSMLNQHCLGQIPFVTFKKYRKKVDNNILISNPLVGNNFMESMRLIRSSVQNSLDADDKVIMVTSTAPGEGKSVTTLNIAAMFAKNEKKVLVIDGDLRASGINDMIAKEDFSSEQKISRYYSIVHLESMKIDIIKFSIEQSDIKNIMNTRFFGDIISDFKKQYDYIFIDTPPCGIISDAMTLLHISDAVIYVIRGDMVMVNSILSGISNLRSSGANIIGCVLNGVTNALGSYSYYGYKGYSRYYSGYGNYGRSHGISSKANDNIDSDKNKK